MEEQIKQWLLEGKTADDIADVVMRSVHELTETHATKAIVLGPMPDDFEDLSLAEAEKRAMLGEIHVCAERGMHTRPDNDESIGYEVRVYHSERNPTPDQIREFVTRTMMRHLNNEDEGAHYQNN